MHVGISHSAAASLPHVSTSTRGRASLTAYTPLSLMPLSTQTISIKSDLMECLVVLTFLHYPAQELMHMELARALPDWLGATVCGLMQWLKRVQADRMVKRYKHAYFNPGVLTVWCLCASMSLEGRRTRSTEQLHWHGLLVAVQGQRCKCETASCTLVTAVTTKLMPQFTSAKE